METNRNSGRTIKSCQLLRPWTAAGAQTPISAEAESQAVLHTVCSENWCVDYLAPENQFEPVSRCIASSFHNNLQRHGIQKLIFFPPASKNTSSRRLLVRLLLFSLTWHCRQRQLVNKSFWGQKHEISICHLVYSSKKCLHMVMVCLHLRHALSDRPIIISLKWQLYKCNIFQRRRVDWKKKMNGRWTERQGCVEEKNLRCSRKKERSFNEILHQQTVRKGQRHKAAIDSVQTKRKKKKNQKCNR